MRFVVCASERFVPGLLSACIAAGVTGASCRDGAPTAAPLARSEASAAPRCASCHPAETEEWEASLHHASFTDHDFQQSFAKEPADFCFHCHAPEATSRADTHGAARGVGCASCHAIAESHGAGDRTARTAACSTCHEFRFPGLDALMQSTVSEHAASASAQTPCVSCHLARASDGHRSHRFDVTRNEELLRGSVAVHSRWTSAGVEIRLATRNVGHAMPTGDLFRRLRIVVHGEGRGGGALGEEIVLLTRRFDRAAGLATEVEDTRLRDRVERRVVVAPPWASSASRIIVETRYDRVASVYDRHEDLFASIVLARETLTP